MNWDQLLSAQRPGQKTKAVEHSRSAFEQDHDRIIFSHPFRRLQDKTQVHPLPEHDFVHTRLTHSLEVSTVGRSLGKKAGEIILQRHPGLKNLHSIFDFGAVVAAGSLAHDLGNPPFGHAGEDAISDFFVHHPFGRGFQNSVSEEQWCELIKFEGNAQGFRILNKDEYGLKLTHAALGAFMKYPCPAATPKDASRKSQKKYGFFEAEKQYFALIADDLGLISQGDHVWCRHPLAFLVEASDDICYSIIDLEDGCRLGLVRFDETVELLATILGDKLNREKLDRTGGLNEKLGVLRAMTISELIDATTEVFADHEADMLDGKFDRALTDLCRYASSLKDITRVSIEKIYRARHVVEIEAAGHEVLPGLLEEFTRAGIFLIRQQQSRKYQNLAMLLPDEVRRDILSDKEDVYGMLRSVIDFVSGMTDRHALSIYRKIKGMSLG